MNALLDTHAFLWWLTANPKLSDKAKAVIEDSSVIRYISSATGFEITNKIRIGKLDFGQPIVENFDSILADGGFDKLPLSMAHTFLAGQMVGVHKDPFDRMLAAQCKLENLSLISVDPAFQEFGIDIIW